MTSNLIFCCKSLGDVSCDGINVKSLIVAWVDGTVDLMDCSPTARTCSCSACCANLFFYLELKHQMDIFMNKYTVSVG